MIRAQEFLILGVLIGVLAAATIVYLLLRRKTGAAPNALLDNLAARIRAWWVMILVLGGAFLAGRHAVIVLFALVSFAALREFITLTPTHRADHAALVLSFFVVLPLQYWLIFADWYGFFAVFVPVYAFLVLPGAAVIFGDPKNFLARTSEMQWGLMISVYCMSHVPALLTLNIRGYQDRNPLLVAFLLIVVQSSDVLQYCLGKTPAAAKSRPNSRLRRPSKVSPGAFSPPPSWAPPCGRSRRSIHGRPRSCPWSSP